MRTPVIGWFMISVMNVFVNQILPKATVRKLSAEELQYYNKPYPSVASRKPIRQWPCEIPIDGHPADVHNIVSDYHHWLQETEIPKLLFHANPGGLISQETAEWIKANFKNLTSVNIGDGLHYLQEDNPHKIGEELATWYSGL